MTERHKWHDDPGQWPPEDDAFWLEPAADDFEDPEWFQELADREATPEREAQLRAELDADPDLAARFAQYSRTLAALRAMGATQSNDDGGASLRSRVLAMAAREIEPQTPRWVPLLASGFVAAAALILYVTLIGSSRGPNNSSSVADSARKMSAEEGVSFVEDAEGIEALEVEDSIDMAEKLRDARAGDDERAKLAKLLLELPRKGADERLESLRSAMDDPLAKAKELLGRKGEGAAARTETLRDLEGAFEARKKALSEDKAKAKAKAKDKASDKDKASAESELSKKVRLSRPGAGKKGKVKGDGVAAAKPQTADPSRRAEERARGAKLGSAAKGKRGSARGRRGGRGAAPGGRYRGPAGAGRGPAGPSTPPVTGAPTSPKGATPPSAGPTTPVRRARSANRVAAGTAAGKAAKSKSQHAKAENAENDSPDAAKKAPAEDTQGGRRVARMRVTGKSGGRDQSTNKAVSSTGDELATRGYLGLERALGDKRQLSVLSLTLDRDGRKRLGGELARFDVQAWYAPQKLTKALSLSFGGDAEALRELGEKAPPAAASLVQVRGPRSQLRGLLLGCLREQTWQPNVAMVAVPKKPMLYALSAPSKLEFDSVAFSRVATPGERVRAFGELAKAITDNKKRRARKKPNSGKPSVSTDSDDFAMGRGLRGGGGGGEKARARQDAKKPTSRDRSAEQRAGAIKAEAGQPARAQRSGERSDEAKAQRETRRAQRKAKTNVQAFAQRPSNEMKDSLEVYLWIVPSELARPKPVESKTKHAEPQKKVDAQKSGDRKRPGDDKSGSKK